MWARLVSLRRACLLAVTWVRGRSPLPLLMIVSAFVLILWLILHHSFASIFLAAKKNTHNCMGVEVPNIPFEKLEKMAPPPSPAPPDPRARDPLIEIDGILERRRSNGDGNDAESNHRRRVHSPSSSSAARSVPRVIWTFWVGPKEMSAARKRSMRMMRKNLGVPLILVRQHELRRYSKPEDPMHPIIFADPPLISGNHIVDYLRAYWIKHYGGGYQDVKPSFYSWAPFFAEFERDPDLWLLGSRMLMAHHIACDESYLRRLGMEPNCSKVKANWQYLVSDAAWIARPGTPLAVEFYDLINGTLNAKWEALRQHPVPARNAGRCCAIWTGTEDDNYPLRWAEMHGEAFDPLQLKHLYSIDADGARRRWHVRQGVPRWEECAEYV